MGIPNVSNMINMRYKCNKFKVVITNKLFVNYFIAQYKTM